MALKKTLCSKCMPHRIEYLDKALEVDEGIRLIAELCMAANPEIVDPSVVQKLGATLDSYLERRKGLQNRFLGR